MGTATYFSPEQAQGAQPDPRSDLYSLGIVMYEMIAGRPPFAGDNPVSIAYKQVHDYPTPLNKLVADVPRPFEAIVAKLLTKDPAVRYSTADSLREDLRRFRTGERPVALAAASRTGQTPTVVGGAVPGRGLDPQMNQRTAVQGRVPGGGRPADGPAAAGRGAEPLPRAAAHRLVRARRLLRPRRARPRRLPALQHAHRRRGGLRPRRCRTTSASRSRR